MEKKNYRELVRGIESACINKVIDDYVLDDVDKEIIKLNLLHGISYTKIADQLEPWISPRSIQNAMNAWMPLILKKLNL